MTLKLSVLDVLEEGDSDWDTCTKEKLCERKHENGAGNMNQLLHSVT